jgi:phasin family protein
MATKDDTPSAAKATAEAASKVGEDATAALSNASAAFGGIFASSIKASQAYHAKLVQFFQANLDANLQFAQKLAAAKTPADVVQLSTSHARDRVEALSEQAKELAELGQEASRKAVEAFSPPRR